MRPSGQRELSIRKVTMKRYLTSALLLLTIGYAKAAVIPFDLSPAGTDRAVGLSPSNEVGTVIGSTGSGNEILGGITFDTTTRVLFPGGRLRLGGRILGSDRTSY